MHGIHPRIGVRIEQVGLARCMPCDCRVLHLLHHQVHDTCSQPTATRGFSAAEVCAACMLAHAVKLEDDAHVHANAGGTSGSTPPRSNVSVRRELTLLVLHERPHLWHVVWRVVANVRGSECARTLIVLGNKLRSARPEALALQTARSRSVDPGDSEAICIVLMALAACGGGRRRVVAVTQRTPTEAQRSR